jgi:hypothetical protein
VNNTANSIAVGSTGAILIIVAVVAYYAGREKKPPGVGLPPVPRDGEVYAASWPAEVESPQWVNIETGDVPQPPDDPDDGSFGVAEKMPGWLALVPNAGSAERAVVSVTYSGIAFDIENQKWASVSAFVAANPAVNRNREALGPTYDSWQPFWDAVAAFFNENQSRLSTLDDWARIFRELADAME